MVDFEADEEMGEVLGPVLEGLLKVDVNERWTAEDVNAHISALTPRELVLSHGDRLYSPLALEKEMMMK